MKLKKQIPRSSNDEVITEDINTGINNGITAFPNNNGVNKRNS